MFAAGCSGSMVCLCYALACSICTQKYYCLVMVMVHPIHSSSLLLLLHSVSTYNAHIAFLLHHIFPANCRNSSYKVNCNRQQRGMNCWCNLFSPFFISTQMSIKHWVLSLKATDSPQISAIYSKYIRLGEWKCAFVHSLTCFLHYSDNKIMSEYFHLRPQREREREEDGGGNAIPNFSPRMIYNRNQSLSLW